MPNYAGNPKSLKARKPGRPPGAKNKTPERLRLIVLEALELEGGVDYLRMIAREEPKTFAALLGRILPRQVGVDAQVTVDRKQELVDAINAGRKRLDVLRIKEPPPL